LTFALKAGAYSGGGVARKLATDIIRCEATPMAIDIYREHLQTAAQAVDELPRGRGGKKKHVSTIHRWFAQGLEYVCIGNTRYTSREALLRFFERRTAEEMGRGAGCPVRSPATRRRKHEQAERKLDTLGVGA
jgi:hypothetical protein